MNLAAKNKAQSIATGILHSLRTVRSDISQNTTAVLKKPKDEAESKIVAISIEGYAFVVI